MVYEQNQTVVCFGNLKQAAIYFDRVLPVNYLRLQEETGDIDLAPIVDDSLKFERASDLNEFKETMAIDNEITDILMSYKFIPAVKVRMTDPNLSYGEALNEAFIVLYLINPPMSEKLLFRDFFKENYLKKYTKYGFSVDSPVLIPERFLPQQESNEDDITLALMNIPTVNTDNTTWEQIVEFRKDADARKKLQNLRLFLHKNYKGESKDFIEKDINMKLEAYLTTCKDWGFETKAAVLSAVASSNNLIATTASIMGSILLNDPACQTISALSGAVLNIGKIALTYAKQKHSFNKLKRDHELAYIIEAMDRLNN